MIRESLKSRVAQQLFLRFLLVTLLPIAGIAGYAYLQVGTLVRDNADKQMQIASRNLGMTLLNRLNMRAEAFDRDVDHNQQNPFIAPATPEIQQQLSPAALDRLKHNGQVLFFPKLHSSTVQLVIRDPTTGTLLTRQLNNDELWRTDLGPSHYCVFDFHRHPLYCTAKIDPDAMASALKGQPAANSGSWVWRQEGQRVIAGFWRIKLMANYANDGLIFVTTEQLAPLEAPLKQFRWFLFAGTALLLGIVIWIAINQIRQQLQPLNRLLQGTERLAKGEFGEKIEIQGNDEFRLLADSFNHMSQRLDQRFHAQQALTRLDQAMLNHETMTGLIHELLDECPKILPQARIAVVELDEHQQQGQLYCGDTRTEALTANSTSTLITQITARDKDHIPGMAVDVSTILPPEIMASLPQENLSFNAYPAFHAERCVAVLLLGHPKDVPLDTEATNTIRNLVDRLSIASAKIAAEEALFHQAHHDLLTGLPNRALIADRTEQAIQRAERDDTACALLLADLDSFKQVNDSLGHNAGDQLLQICANRLIDTMRQVDTVARLGGDEFVILLPDLPKDHVASILHDLADRINRALAQPAIVAGRDVTSHASIGIALYPHNGGHFDDLLKMADAAMYEAKRSPTTDFTFYSQHMNSEVHERFELSQLLRSAIENQEMLLHYQPKIDLDTGAIVGAEALIRWNSPTRGLVAPRLFLDLIDDLGLGNRLGEWVLQDACIQMQRWDESGLPPIPISINLSPIQFQDPQLADKVQRTLIRRNLGPERLEIEMLEATAIDPSPTVQHNLDALRQADISIALDDFGTGYSSLVYLAKVPATTLKLDRAFIRNLDKDPRQQAIVSRIISLAKSLDMLVVAEGVETEAERALMAEMGCDQCQGFLFSEPVPADAFARLLA